MLKTEIYKFITKNRIKISRFYFLSIILLVLFSNPLLKESVVFEFFLESTGLLFVAIASFGRLWSLVYISGYKSRSIIQLGAYSMVRNPLYFFSLIGAIGVGLISSSLLITFLMFLFFTLIYPFVVISEEQKLEDIFGDEYREYKTRVPRFIPNIKLYKDSDSYNINLKSYKKEFLDAIWFILSFMLFQLIDLLHHYGYLKTFINII